MSVKFETLARRRFRFSSAQIFLSFNTELGKYISSSKRKIRRALDEVPQVSLAVLKKQNFATTRRRDAGAPSQKRPRHLFSLLRT